MPFAKQEQLKGTHYVAVATEISPAISNCVSKLQLNDPSLNVGVGAGSLYMLITCHKEMRKLNKTLEETETLVQELRQQLQRHQEDSKSYQAHLMQNESSSMQNLQADMIFTGQPYYHSRTFSSNEIPEEQVPTGQGMAKDQMAALAAELEAELELMELNMKAEETHAFETYIHDGGEVSSKGLSNSYYSDTSSYGMLEGSDIGRASTQLEACQMDYGVSPTELEHRLREVLEAQQEERILELEQLLKQTKAKLLAKEHEILCWKNHVNSLTNLLQPPSTCKNQLLRLNKPSGAELISVYDNFVGAVPEVTKSTVELPDVFQDPPILTQVSYVEASSTTDLFGDVSKQETKPQSFSIHGLRSEKCSLNKASTSASPFFTGSKGLVEAGEPVFYREASIDIPEDVAMRDFVSADVDEKLSGRTGLDISRLHHMEYKLDTDGCYVDEDDTPSGRSGLEVSSFHYMNWRFGMDQTPRSSLLRTEELERDSDDIKHMVNFNAPKSGEACESFGEVTMLAGEAKLKDKNRSLQLASKGLKVTYNRTMKVTSPVLDKIRHFEALGEHAREQQT